MATADWAELSPGLTQSWIVCVVGVLVHVIGGVSGDPDGEDDVDSCGGACVYGCCGNRKCCSSPYKAPSYSVQIIAVVGAFLVTLLLLLLCFVRYRCLSRNRRPYSRSCSNGARRGCRRPRHSSVFSLSVPPNSMGSFLTALSSLDRAQIGNTGGQLVLPPPYSELDGFSSPGSTSGQVSGSVSVDVGHGEPPPAYADVVKIDCVTQEEVSAQQEVSAHQEMSTREEGGN